MSNKMRNYIALMLIVLGACIGIEEAVMEKVFRSRTAQITAVVMLLAGGLIYWTR